MPEHSDRHINIAPWRPSWARPASRWARLRVRLRCFWRRNASAFRVAYTYTRWSGHPWRDLYLRFEAMTLSPCAACGKLHGRGYEGWSVR
jgi:hypothetical protein